MFKEYYNYLVYEDGRVYSKFTNKFLKGDLTIHGYIQYSLAIDRKPIRIKAHRLVAKLFLQNHNDYDMVNHIDGDKLNNHYTNLEWCDCEHNNRHARINNLNNISENNSKRWNCEGFRRKTSKNISEGRKKNGCAKGSSNPRFRYKIFHNGKEVTRKDLTIILNRAQSTIDQRIKKSSDGKIVKEFIDNNIVIIDTKKG